MAIAQEYNWRYIFHFTPIHNLDSIIKNGLLCTNEKEARVISHKNIANMNIENRRAKMEVTCTAVPAGQTCSVMPQPNTGIIQSWRSAPCGGRKGEDETKALRKTGGDKTIDRNV